MNYSVNKRATLGILLLAVGLILLAANAGWFDVTIWPLFKLFWPLLLLAAGLRLLISKLPVYLFSLALVLVATSLLISYTPSIRENFRAAIDQDRYIPTKQVFKESLEDSPEQLDFNLRFNARTTVINASQNADQAYRAQFDKFPEIDEDDDDENGLLAVGLRPEHGTSYKRTGQRAEIALNSELPVSLRFTSDTGKKELDFTNVNLQQLKLHLGRSSGMVTLGTRAANLSAEVKANSSFTLRLPRTAVLVITADRDLNPALVAQLGLTKEGNIYRTAGADTTAQVIDLRLMGDPDSFLFEQY